MDLTLLPLWIFTFLFGSCIGSFLNVVIYRVPQKISIARGRSFCPTCRRTLRPIDMVPVLSWLCLKGRCHFCGSKISVRYPIVEALGGLFALLCAFALGYSRRALLAFAVLALLLAVALIDLDTLEIPNGLLVCLAGLAAVSFFIFPQVGLVSRLAGFWIVSLPMFLLTLAIPDCFGGGDMKLIAVCGFLLGWKQTLLAAFLALLTGGLYGVYLLLSHRANRKSHFAFGPFLAFGVGTALLYGGKILLGYLSLFHLV